MTKLKFHFSNLLKLEDLIRLKVNGLYEINPIYYADMIELKDDAFKHTIYFNESGNSKIVTERKSWLEVIIGWVIIIGLIVFSELVLDGEWNLLWVALFGIFFMIPSITEMIAPSEKVEIEQKHAEIIDFILSINKK